MPQMHLKIEQLTMISISMKWIEGDTIIDKTTT
jgi:hypothetical protein